MIVKNPSKFAFEGQRTKVEFSTCQEEIALAKQNSWFCRIFCEIEETIKSGGFVIAVLLTYNEKHLPRFYGIPCFDGSHISWLFGSGKGCSNLRYILRRDHGADLKYMVSSEYGEEKKRPHYHALVHVTPSTSKRAGKWNLTVYELFDLIKKFWQGDHPYWAPQTFDYGIVSHSEKHQWYITPSTPEYDKNNIAKYISKYVSKGSGENNFEELMFKRLRQVAHKQTLDEPDLFDSFCEDYDRKKGALVEFIRQSNLKFNWKYLLYPDFKKFLLDNSYFHFIDFENLYEVNLHNLRVEYVYHHSPRVRSSKCYGSSGINRIVKNDANNTVSFDLVVCGKPYSTVPQYLYRKYFYTEKVFKVDQYHKLSTFSLKPEHWQFMSKKITNDTLELKRNFVLLTGLSEDLCLRAAEYFCVYYHRYINLNKPLCPKLDFLQFVSADPLLIEYPDLESFFYYETDLRPALSHPYFKDILPFKDEFYEVYKKLRFPLSYKIEQMKKQNANKIIKDAYQLT